MFKSQTVLITGASSGIGLEFAKLFAEQGCDLLLLARRKQRLDELKQSLLKQFSIKIEVIDLDLNLPNIEEHLTDRLQGRVIDVLVNNAGFGAHGKFYNLDRNRQLDMVQLNIKVLTNLTHMFLPGMLERKQGAILNVASVAAFPPGPMMTVYYATKAYVLSFTEGLAEELSDTPIKVSCLCPGPTTTEFGEASEIDSRKFSKVKSMSASVVAKIGLQGLKQSKVIVVPGLSNKLLIALIWLVPRSLVRKIVKWLQV